MEFIALGDTEDVAASAHFLDIGGTGLVLDAGTDPRREGRASLPRYDLIHDHPDHYIDHAIVTHAHHDHMGSLPVLVREFPHALVHMTDATRRLLEFLLPASARLQKKRLEQGETDEDPLFTEDELSFHSHIYLTHELAEDFDVTGVGGAPVQGRFYTAGHILGSVGVELRFEEAGKERSVFYTSDTNLQAQSIIPGGQYPASTDVLILESTLGNDEEAEQTSRPEEVDRFKTTLAEVIDRGGTAVVPVFVMGRAQETLALLGRLKDEGVIGREVPVYTAGSMRAVADLYDKTRTSTPRIDPEFRVFDVDQDRVPYGDKAKRDLLNGPGIFVVSSGMMFEPTLSNKLARRIVENEEDAVLLVGYAKEGTPARRLQEAAEEEEGTGSGVMLADGYGPQPVNCTVERFRFSGHSNRRDLLSLVDRMQPETVLLVHGETEAREWMAEHIRADHPAVDVHLPAGGEPIEV
jgi:Cft2 family RNA processing exonuclease